MIQARPRMDAQYFAKDYHDFYDANGYCVEQGSQQAPHRGLQSAAATRCNHSVEAWNKETSDTFCYVNVPVPMPETETREQQ